MSTALRSVMGVIVLCAWAGLASAQVASGKGDEEFWSRVPQEATAAEAALRRLPQEAAQRQLSVLYSIATDERWTRIPGVEAALRGLMQNAADPRVASGAVRAALRLHARALRPRLEAVRDGALFSALAAEDERLAVLERGGQLPGFLRTPPSVFPAELRAGAGSTVRVVAIGDFGTGGDDQRAVAAAMARVHRNAAFDVGITVGDNFYESGLPRPDDPRWQTQWEALYGPLGVRFYPTFGNHDWLHPDSPAAELFYAQRSSSWRMPAAHYTFTAGAAQFFALDTANFTPAQARWLEQAIAASRARWKIVYDHHPISDTTGYTEPDMRAQLWPRLRGRVDAYFCGHTHSLGQMRAEDGVHFFIVGGGGRRLQSVDPRHPQAQFAASLFGFASIEVSAARLSVALHDASGATVHSAVVEK